MMMIWRTFKCTCMWPPPVQETSSSAADFVCPPSGCLSAAPGCLSPTPEHLLGPAQKHETCFLKNL